MLPYLERDFAEICVAHRDEKQKVIQDVREADVLVVSAVERFDRGPPVATSPVGSPKVSVILQSRKSVTGISSAL